MSEICIDRGRYCRNKLTPLHRPPAAKTIVNKGQLLHISRCCQGLNLATGRLCVHAVPEQGCERLCLLKYLYLAFHLWLKMQII